MTEQDLVGRRFGAYDVLEVLGTGGMGKVYKARNVTLERVVALKTLAAQFSTDDAFVQRFLKEARAAARLNHPNIVQIYDFGCEEGVYFLAMEYVDGPSLRKLLGHARLAERDAVLLIRHAVAALAVAHAQGLVHRDIKPDNLMLTAKRDRLKLVDLGIAKRIDEDQGLTQTGQAVGTPQYISPEQIRGVKHIDARADIYSLGATFFQLVTGHAPFEGTSGALIMSMHLTHPLPDPRTYVPELSIGVCRVLRKMMAKDRDERYRDVQALDRDLYRLQIGETPEPDEPSASGIATFVSAEQPPAEHRAPVHDRAAAAPPPAPSQAAPVPEARAAAPAEPASPAPGAAPAFREEDLHFVEVELARRIGPLAKVLVKRAAKSASNLVALGAALADNIPDEEERREFRAAVRARAS
ncbi:MAG TPA: serine/threonine-protein kinase [Thermoanaerobaculia bacterium]|nr:serine/threonine-protein kinase [Thermoanaerobaculia bacterium]